MNVLVLASGSATRARVLRAAGVAFEIEPSGVNEAPIKRAVGSLGADAVADRLAEAKALDVGRRRPEALVIGADQTLECEGRLYDKPCSLEAAKEQLRALRGRTHVLHAALACAEGEAVVWRWRETPRVRMRAFSDAFVEAYVERNREIATGSVGAYALEGEGAQLIDAVDGDFFAVLGLPLLPLLGFLRTRGVLRR